MLIYIIATWIKNHMLPLIFFGHGSPMNAIEHNRFTQGWRDAVVGIKAKAIVMISAHWDTPTLKVTANAHPPTLHDFGGFPPKLHAARYPAPGAPELAARIAALTGATLDERWGLDHGTWSILVHTHPSAEIPVVQLSINSRLSPQWHYELGQRLKPLRDEGVLLVASGNLVHNLRLLDWGNGPSAPWAERFLQYCQHALLNGDDEALLNYQAQGQDAALAVPHPDHYLPLCCLLGARGASDAVQLFNDELTMGSLAMTSIKFGT